MLTLAEKFGGNGFKLQAHHAAWATSFGLGKLADVGMYVQAGLGLYDVRVHQAMASAYGNHDASTCARNFAALAPSLEGERERARSMANSSLAVAYSLNDPFSLALTLFFTAATAQVLGDIVLAAERAESGQQIATDHDL